MNTMMSMKWTAQATKGIKVHEKFDNRFEFTGVIPLSELPADVREWAYDHVDRFSSWKFVSAIEFSHFPVPEEIIAAARIVIEKEKQEAAAKSDRIKTAIEKFEAMPIEDLIWKNGTTKNHSCSNFGLKHNDCEHYNIITTLMKMSPLKAAEITRYQEEIRQQKKITEEAKKKAADEKEARNQAEMAQLLEENLDEVDRRRYTDGRMPEDEIRAMLRNALWADRDAELPRYRRLSENNIECDCPDSYDFETNFWVEKIDVEMTKPQYIQYLDIKKIFPADRWIITPRLHKGECETCNGEITSRLGIHVSTSCGPYTLSREYGVDPD